MTDEDDGDESHRRGSSKRARYEHDYVDPYEDARDADGDVQGTFGFRTASGRKIEDPASKRKYLFGKSGPPSQVVIVVEGKIEAGPVARWRGGGEAPAAAQAQAHLHSNLDPFAADEPPAKYPLLSPPGHIVTNLRRVTRERIYEKFLQALTAALPPADDTCWLWRSGEAGKSEVIGSDTRSTLLESIALGVECKQFTGSRTEAVYKNACVSRMREIKNLQKEPEESAPQSAVMQVLVGNDEHALARGKGCRSSTSGIKEAFVDCLARVVDGFPSGLFNGAFKKNRNRPAVVLAGRHHDPHLPKTGITLEFVTELLAHLRAQKKLHRKFRGALNDIFTVDPCIVDILIPEFAKLTACGDIHGREAYDLL
ncbi:hypothetical protein BDK51DRAFT_39579 [Blyttiomyces helicus]|uniref:Uncharacterized protein n=1 Tax=Blyttiomyces helicus TaxID=388810 RepID=A0A4P9W5W5_9FUNG|nr:hypothetical protein BDK51DRAFT_39579 [Blyttiomyces helicus]|eukprot:RKO87821.1 hypothetical protein BDK51DRAFT_39579 [Blyttiomyces helicus]